jgi:hypothetical protein
MTGTYDWNPMPHVVEVRCPDCRSPATFEFAEVVRIRRKGEIPLFQKHRLLEYGILDGRAAAGRWHGAIFYAGLHARGTSALRGLPDGYSPSDWNHSRYFFRSHPLGLGAVVCPNCHVRRKHALHWPSDARFQIVYRGQCLWAFNRESAVALRDYVASGSRKRSKWSSFLLHVPRTFLTAKARSHVVTLLDRVLAAQP